MVCQGFDLESAKGLLRAMRALVKAAQPERAEEEAFEWDPNLPKMEIKVGAKTLVGIQETLQSCEPRVQQMYATLIEGWNQAGGDGAVQPSWPYLSQV